MRTTRQRVRSSEPAATTAPQPLPAMRYMTVIAQDPSVRTKGSNGPILMAKIAVPAEALVPGPMGYRVQVVDYDSTTHRFNGAHELPEAFEKEPAAWRNGTPSIVDDYRFHAQNVYALVMKTLARFEFALGRRVGWSFRTHQLKVAPHGMVDANAFYSPREEGIVFGYFAGRKGGKVYTCLSHDVVVHETTHALIDALRERYLDPSSPDQAAFHEGLSDVIALLSVFAQPELLGQLLQPSAHANRPPMLISKADVTPEKLREGALFRLAEQMGDEIENARGSALRQSASIPADPKILDRAEFLEPHRRGEILVAAVMNGFIEAWAARIAKSGVPGQSSYPVIRVAEEGAEIAEALVTMWIRALDYMPPVHLEFPDALSAALTADLEVRPDDTRFGLRTHMLRSFRAYGIRPASTEGVVPGIWKHAPGGLCYDRVRFESLRKDPDEVFRFLWENRDGLELRAGAFTEVLTVRPCVRIDVDGFTLHETVAQYYQVARLTPEELRQRKIAVPKEYLDELRKQERMVRTQRRATTNGDAGERADRPRNADDDETLFTTPLYGGGVLIFDEYGRLKYHVHNDVFGERRQSERLRYLWETGQLEAGKDGARLQASRLSTIHRLRAIDARRFRARGW